MMDRIPRQQLAARIDAVRQIMARESVEHLVIYGGPRRLFSGGTVHYLAGWAPPTSSTVMIIGPRGLPRILADGPNVSRVFEQRTEGLAETQMVMGGPQRLAETILDSLASRAPMTGRLGVVGHDAMPGVLQRALVTEGRTLIHLDAQVEALRLCKTPEEVAMHARAAAISDGMVARAMELAGLSTTTPGELMAAVEYEGRRRGADFASLWLATGERPSATYFELFELPPAIGPNDRVQMGTAVTYEGYFGQTLRMGVRGNPSKALKACAQRLVDMQEEVLALMRPGVPVHGIVDRLETLIDAHCPYERQSDPFRFQSCHALGVDYAESAYMNALSPASVRERSEETLVLAENMVFEIHPNFTLPDLGHVCAGDMAVVTGTGARWLTAAPRGLVELDG